MSDFYEDKWWCPNCRERVSYLECGDGNYCVQCDGKVKMFSPEEWDTFTRTLEKPSRAKRGKGKRTKKRKKRKRKGGKREEPLDSEENPLGGDDSWGDSDPLEIEGY